MPAERILLVEDRHSNRTVAILLLQRLGYCAVDVASSGVEAVDAAVTHSYQLILMDLQLPELDGFDATRQIRQAEAKSGRHTPIVALTAQAMEGDRERCLAAGMDDYISKPYNMQTLRDTLSRWIPAQSAASG
jgi:CheY-like chemotaxis protein